MRDRFLSSMVRLTSVYLWSKHRLRKVSDTHESLSDKGRGWGLLFILTYLLNIGLKIAASGRQRRFHCRAMAQFGIQKWFPHLFGILWTLTKLLCASDYFSVKWLYNSVSCVWVFSRPSYFFSLLVLFC